jgi:CHAT domain-containing protein
MYNEIGENSFNYVISSYTPSLTALLHSSQTKSKSFTGILAIAEPSSLPATKQEVQLIKEQFTGLPFTQLIGEQATVSNVLHEMNSHSWVHFACHGIQDAVEPTKSAFILHNHSRLDLQTIMKKPLHHAQVAFLSACQTAAGASKLPDESAHLAAGMLMAGYSTVFATMWSIRDQDAPLVARDVYVHLLEGIKDLGICEGKAAKALHLAMVELHKRVGVKNFMFWVPFIHIGI